MNRYVHFRGNNMHWIDKVHPLSLEILGEEDIMTITPYPDQTNKRMMIFRVRMLFVAFNYTCVEVWKFHTSLSKKFKIPILFQFGIWKPSKIPVDELFKATLICLEVGIMEPRAQINGGVGIFDMEGFGLNHTLHMSPTIAQKTIAMIVVSINSLTLNL